MKLTLLSMIQSVLNDMDGDIVNSISDTVESVQVSVIIRDAYFDLLTIRDWDFLNTYRQLDAASDSTKPTKLIIPENVADVFDFWYRVDLTVDTNEEWAKLKYLEPTEFIKLVNARGTSSSDVTAFDTGTGATINVATDKMPQWYTSFDDNFIFCDSIDFAEDSTLQESKTKIFAKEEQVWTPTNDFIPTLNSELFPMLLNEAKARASLKLKQDLDESANSWRNRHYRKLKALGNRTVRVNESPNYGR